MTRVARGTTCGDRGIIGDEVLGAAVARCWSASIAVNATAPRPERNATFTRVLAAALHRPALLPVPGFALKLALGGFGGALLDSQRALPEALTADGFRFKYPDLEAALQNLESAGGTSGC